MNFIKYVKYALLTIATILVTAISVLLAAVIIEMITWNEAGKWIIAFFELAGISLLLSIIWITIGTTIAKDSKKTDKK
jgi:dolichyl-phosphate-mannose--protein O-mannosyl transferase